MSPAAHALDRRLHGLRTAHEAVATSIHDLEAEGTYALLTAGDRVSGTTASKARPALERVAGLRRGLEELDHMLEQVSVLRGTGIVDDHQAAELFALLNSPSILFPTEPRRAVTPEALLTEIDQAFTPLREVVAEVDTAWRQFLPRLERVSEEADRLAAGLPGFRSVAAARTTLTALPDRVIDDPLGASEELARVETALAGAVDAGSKVAAMRTRLAAAAATIEELEATLASGHQALARTRALIVEPEGLLDPVDPEAVTGERGLRPWLARLERLVGEGEVPLVEKGLESWTATAERTLDAARQIAEANARPLQRRQELANLLRAARVKAGASGRSEDPWMAEVFDRAEQALHAVPCCLVTATSQVDVYLEELRRCPTPAQAAKKEMSA